MFLHAYNVCIRFAVDAVSSGRWFAVLKVQTLDIAMLTIFLHRSNLDLGSVANFSNTELHIQQNMPLFSPVKANVVWMNGLDENPGNISLAAFIFHQKILPLKMSSSSFLTEIFDPDR